MSDQIPAVPPGQWRQHARTEKRTQHGKSNDGAMRFPLARVGVATGDPRGIGRTIVDAERSVVPTKLTKVGPPIADQQDGGKRIGR